MAKKPYSMQAEAGRFEIRMQTNNPIANAAAVAVESLTHPNRPAVLLTPKSNVVLNHNAHVGNQTAAPGEAYKQAPLDTRFKYVLTIVTCITVLAIIIHAIGVLSIQAPTEAQKNFFSSLGSIWTAGAGAIFGLLGGKSA